MGSMEDQQELHIRPTPANASHSGAFNWPDFTSNAPTLPTLLATFRQMEDLRLNLNFLCHSATQLDEYTLIFAQDIEIGVVEHHLPLHLLTWLDEMLTAAEKAWADEEFAAAVRCARLADELLRSAVNGGVVEFTSYKCKPLKEILKNLGCAIDLRRGRDD